MEIEDAIMRYRKGEVSLFEAAEETDMLPMEFMNALIEQNRKHNRSIVFCKN